MKNVKNLVLQPRVDFSDPKIDGRVLLKLYDIIYIETANIQHNINSLYLNWGSKLKLWKM
jgi:hypothetical protein